MIEGGPIGDGPREPEATRKPHKGITGLPAAGGVGEAGEIVIHQPAPDHTGQSFLQKYTGITPSEVPQMQMQGSDGPGEQPDRPETPREEIRRPLESGDHDSPAQEEVVFSSEHEKGSGDKEKQQKIKPTSVRAKKLAKRGRRNGGGNGETEGADDGKEKKGFSSADKRPPVPVRERRSTTIRELLGIMAEDHPELKLDFGRAYDALEDLDTGDEQLYAAKFPTREALSRLGALAEIPAVDLETGVYTDEEADRHYASRNIIIERTGIDPEIFDRLADRAERREIRSRSGRLIQGYRIEDFTDPTPVKEQEAPSTQSTDTEVDRPQVPARRSAVDATDSTDYDAKIAAITPDAIKEDPSVVRGLRWTKIAKSAPGDVERFIESVALSLVASGERLTGKDLHEKHSSFERAVLNFYPGKFAGLRSALGLEETVQQRKHDWVNDPNPQATVRRELAEIPDTQLTGRELLRRNLWKAVAEYYPGGYQQLLQDRGIEARRRPEGYWEDPKNIRSEVREIIEREGSLARTREMKERYGAVFVAIARHYPGGMNAILEEFGQKE
jgi:hypothetical protein